MRGLAPAALVALTLAFVPPATAQVTAPAGGSQAVALVADLQSYAPQIADVALRCLGPVSAPTPPYEIEVNGVWANPPLAGKQLAARARYTPLGNGAVIVDGHGEENPDIRRTGQHVSVFPGVAIWSVSHVEHVGGGLKGRIAHSYSIARDITCSQPLLPLAAGKEVTVSSVVESWEDSASRPEHPGSRQRSWTLKVVGAPMSLSEVRTRYRNVVFSGPSAERWKFHELRTTLHTGAVVRNAEIEGRYLFVEGLNAFVQLWDGQLRDGHSTRVVEK